MQSLNDVLNDAQESEAQEVVTEDAEALQQEQESTTEAESQNDADETEASKGEESEKQDEVKRETPERETEKEDWTFAAYRDEKRKRQELEKRIEELTKAEQQDTKAPDVLNDPDGFQQFQQQQLDQKITNVKAEMSQFYAEKEFGKEKVQNAFNKFSEMVKENPNLYTQAIGAVSPYHEIVEIVDKASKFEQMQNIDEYESKLRAEIEQKLRAEFEKEHQQKSAKKSSVTPSLNSLTQAEGQSDNVISQSLGDLLGR